MEDHRDKCKVWEALPCDCGYDAFHNERVTLRDRFAIAALQGLIVNPNTCSADVPITARAYELADAMLWARNGRAG